MRRPSLQSLLFGLNGLKDGEGRPLGEMRAPRGAREGVPMAMRPCPYAGSRLGLPMNTSALRQMQGRWPEVLATLRGHRRAVEGALASLPPLPPWGDALAVATGCLLPPVLAHLMGRSPTPLEAAVYKVAAGAHALFKALLERSLTGRSPQEGSVDAALGWAEESGRLVADGEACAGPPAMLRQAMAALMTNDGGEAVPAPQGLGLGAVRLTLQSLWCLGAQWADCLWEEAILAAVCEMEGFTRAPDDPILRNVWEQLSVVRRQRDLDGLQRGLTALLPHRRWLEHVALSHAPLRRYLDGLASRAPLRPQTADWLTEACWSYAQFRKDYLQALQSFEEEASRALGVEAIDVAAHDRSLWGRLHANAWLEALLGSAMEITRTEVRLRSATAALIVPL